jgi:hypothetical protein
MAMDLMTIEIIISCGIILFLGIIAIILWKIFRKKNPKVDPMKISEDIMKDFNKAEEMIKKNRDMDRREILWEIAREHFINDKTYKAEKEVLENGKEKSKSRIGIKQSPAEEQGTDGSESAASESELREQSSGREDISCSVDSGNGSKYNRDKKSKSSDSRGSKKGKGFFSRFRR